KVYDRIRWDPRFDPARFVIGYEARLPEPREVAFTAFVPDGEIPWHRILYFREGDTIVWDRRTRLDAIFDPPPQKAEVPRTEPLVAGAFFQPLQPHRYSSARGAWIEVEPAISAAGSAPEAVRIATFNVLCDAFDDLRTHLDDRLPALVA